MDSEKTKFVDKYAPQKISDMILSRDLKEYFSDMIASKKFVNCSLIAGPGIGKTTLAKTLAKESNAEVLFLSCAAGDGKVETIQSKLIPFVGSVPFDERPMFVILDELDSASATQDSSFQKALRNVIEASSNVVYIATANYAQKIIPAIISRCPQIKLTFSVQDIYMRLKTILDEEKIEYTEKNLKLFTKLALKKYYPDIRSVINYLQGCCSSGSLKIVDGAVSEIERMKFVSDLTSYIFENSSNILGIRQFYLKNKDKISDYEDMAGEIFKHVLSLDNVVLEKDVVIKLADVLYQMNSVIDKEISFFQFVTVLSKLTLKNKTIITEA